MKQTLINTLADIKNYKDKFIPAGGKLHADNLTKAYYHMANTNGITDTILLGYISGGASNTRTSGVYKFYTKLYSLFGTNDVTQTTEASQPYVSGNIAPNEVEALKQPTGDTRTMTHPSITFTGTLTTVIASDTTGKTIITQTDYTDETRTSISFNGRLYAYIIHGSTLTASQKTEENNLLSEIYPDIPSIQIGTDDIATSSLELTTTPQGNVIANVTLTADWINSTNLYDAAYAAQTGTTSEKEYSGLLAAAMWCYYNNDAEIGAVYGKLYNGYAMKLFKADIAATTGWGYHIPTDTDWDNITTIVSSDTDKLKENSENYWPTGNTGTNQTGFTSLPAGWRDVDGTFKEINQTSLFLTDGGDVVDDIIGGSIRLVKD